MSTDQIKKTVFLQASRARIWKALSDINEFGDWFGVKLNGQFVPGSHLRGKVTHQGYEHYPFEIMIDRVEPRRLLSWRWHPNAVDSKVDYSSEPTTLVVFELEDAPGGTQLTLVESGFDGIPESRRSEAHRGNEQGWTMQMESIQRHVTQAA